MPRRVVNSGKLVNFQLFPLLWKRPRRDPAANATRSDTLGGHWDHLMRAKKSGLIQGKDQTARVVRDQAHRLAIGQEALGHSRIALTVLANFRCATRGLDRWRDDPLFAPHRMGRSMPACSTGARGSKPSQELGCKQPSAHSG